MISTTKDGSLGGNSQINQYQTQSQSNAQTSTVSAPSNGTLSTLRNGDNAITVDGTQLVIRQGAAKGSMFTFSISNAATGLKPYQTGTVAPTVATNFPAEGDFGWYENTTGPTYYWVINHGGTLRNISLSTLDGTLGPTQHGDQSANVTALHAMTQISGSITATQHGNFTAATANDSLHAAATTSHPGFLSTAFFDLLNGADVNSSANTLVLRSAIGNSQFNSVNLRAIGGGSGTLQVNSVDITTANNTIATTAATADTLVRRGSAGGTSFAGTLEAAVITASSTVDGTIFNATSSQYKSNGTKVVGARQTGWSAPTGTASRATFDTTSVSVEQLAQRVYALLQDLGQTSGHGLISSV
jgi:hypothetical protein